MIVFFQQVLSLGPPYPLVVLPVEGDYWMEGTNHIQQRDRHSGPILPKFNLSKCIVESDQTATVYRTKFLGKVNAFISIITEFFILQIMFNVTRE